MEDMEIDQIVDVPDTPDRLTARHIIDRKYVGNPDVADEKNEKSEQGCLVAKNGNNRRLAIHPVNNSNNDKVKNSSDYIQVSSSKESHASENASLFRRASSGRIFVHERTHSNGSEKMDKGKGIYTKFPSKSSSNDDLPVLNLTEENGFPQRLKTALSHYESKDPDTKNKKEWNTSIGSSCLPSVSDSFNTSSNCYPGKFEIEGDLHPGHIAADHGKSIDLSGDSQPKTEKQLSLHPCVSTTPRVNGQKRLVRNGCISPHNIGTWAKQLTEQNSSKINDNGQSHAGHVSGQKRLVRNGCISPHNIASRAKQWTGQNSDKINDNEQSQHAVSSSTMSPISIDYIIAEEKGSNSAKGKEVLVHPSSSAHDAVTIDGVTASSSPVINCEEADDSTQEVRNALNCSGGSGGWRSTCNHRDTDQPIYEFIEHHSSRNNDFRSHSGAQYENRLNTRHAGSSHSSKNVHSSFGDRAAQVSPVVISESDQLTGPRPVAGKLTKRQRKRGSTLTIPDEVSDNSEIMFLGSSGESSNSGSSRSPALDPDMIELLSETKYTDGGNSQVLDVMNYDDSDALARQLEADEILARELQEQLYHEDSFGGAEIDEHLALGLQHDEDLFLSFPHNHHSSRPRQFERASSNRLPRLLAHQNSLNRRRVRTQVPPPNRMSQLRSQSSTHTMSSRGRNFRFPFDMDLDMRLDILEALEDLSDMGMADDIFQTQRDFNENDYEMLLALDENNHRHAGASSDQISSLPQSTIQTDNFDEACAICLETPVRGETIRHLPCLHKFHKDCIDPWLRRKTSCPVCKSSIT